MSLKHSLFKRNEYTSNASITSTNDQISCDVNCLIITQNRNACRCREDCDAQLPDKSCNLTCSGNSNELCGGLMDQLNAYVVYTGRDTSTVE